MNDETPEERLRADNSNPCNHCGGDGRGIEGEEGGCPVCRGKGRWTAEDIRNYHLNAPRVCRASCGAVHREPVFGPITMPSREEVEALTAKVEALLAKYA